jgi:hypothetical protein
MNIPRLFRLPEHRKFSYRPVYYDPAKDRRRTGLQDTVPGRPSEKLRTGLEHGSMRYYFKRKEAVKIRSNTRLIILVLLLLFITYLLLFR